MTLDSALGTVRARRWAVWHVALRPVDEGRFDLRGLAVQVAPDASSSVLWAFAPGLRLVPLLLDSPAPSGRA